MKITSVDVRAVAVPRPMPASLPDSLRATLSVPLAAVVVRVGTDAGIEGVGHTLTLNPEFHGSLCKITEELGQLLIGLDPRQPEQIVARMYYPANWIGPGGLLNIAGAALDIAVWDIIGKDYGQPIWRLLGGASNAAPVYDSGSLLAEDLDALQRAAEASVKAGYKAMKMRPGNDRFGPMADVVRRVRAVRDAIGPDIALMYDINQTWSPSRAISMGRALEDLDLHWIEDPTLMHDIDGQAEIAAALSTPICSGEYHYDAPSLLRLLKARAVDILMVDLLRVGGITQFRKVAALAEAFGIQIASHIIPEVYAHCIAGIPNGQIVEGMPWTEDLFLERPALKDGQLVLTEAPGHGLVLDEQFIKKNLVS